MGAGVTRTQRWWWESPHCSRTHGHRWPVLQWALSCQWCSALLLLQRGSSSTAAVQQPAEDAPSDAELADTPTPKPQGGLWTLTAPDGRTYQADSPLRCCGLEQRERVPADVAMARIFRAASEPDDSELLDWLDATNKRFKMGWKVGVAPAGNCSVQSVIFLGNSEPVTIRAAIRAALLATPPKD